MIPLIVPNLQLSRIPRVLVCITPDTGCRVVQEWLSLSTLLDAPIFNIPTGVVNSEPGKSSSMIKAVEDQKKIHRLSNSSTIATLYQKHTQHHHQFLARASPRCDFLGGERNLEIF